jgi:hypothetical protein
MLGCLIDTSTEESILSYKIAIGFYSIKLDEIGSRYPIELG